MDETARGSNSVISLRLCLWTKRAITESLEQDKWLPILYIRGSKKKKQPAIESLLEITFACVC